MLKNFLYLAGAFFLLIIFIFVFQTSLVQAGLMSDLASKASVIRSFGGQVINATATEIETLEKSGWTCVVPGESISIKPVGSFPISYFIPAAVKSKTNYALRQNQWILGLYNNAKTTITCTKECPPAVCTTTVNLDTITMFGTSK